MNEAIRPRVGAFVLETLTTGLYLDPLDTVRELIQNSFDSINQKETESSQVAHNNKIEISLDSKGRNISIWDNGTGIKSDDVVSSLLNVGMSKKTVTDNVGFRGIGRLAGIAYCNRMLFETTAAGEAKRSLVKFDCEGIRKELVVGVAGNVELHEVIENNTTVTYDSYANINESYFQVTLEGILENADIFLSVDEVEKYLNINTPVDFDVQRFYYAPIIHKWLKSRNITYPSAKLVLKSQSGERQIYKPYTINYHTQRDKLKVDMKGIKFFPEDASSASTFWGWYGVTDLLGMIEHDAAGIRIRKNNFAVGGSKMMESIFGRISKSNERFNNWYIGEIHILGDVTPNSRRDGFEESGDWPEIQTSLTKYAESLSKDIREASTHRNRPFIKVVNSAEKLNNKVEKTLEIGLASKEHKNELIENINKELNKLNAAADAQRTDEEKEKITDIISTLEESKNKVTGTNRFVASAIGPQLNKRERRVIERIIKLLHSKLDEKKYEDIRDAILEEFGMSKKRTRNE